MRGAVTVLRVVSPALVHMLQGPSASGTDQDAGRACTVVKALLSQGDVPGAVAVAQSLKADVLKVSTPLSCELWDAAKVQRCTTA